MKQDEKTLSRDRAYSGPPRLFCLGQKALSPTWGVIMSPSGAPWTPSSLRALWQGEPILSMQQKQQLSLQYFFFMKFDLLLGKSWTQAQPTLGAQWCREPLLIDKHPQNGASVRPEQLY